MHTGRVYILCEVVEQENFQTVIEPTHLENCYPAIFLVGIFLLRFARKNLEETNAAVRIRNHVATSTISEKAVAFLFSAKFQLCEDVLQVELHNSFRLTSRFYPDSRRRLRLFFSIPTVCIVLFILFKTLFHLYPQGVKLS